MNSQINSHLAIGFVEDHIRAATEARLLPEYQREPRAHRPAERRRLRFFSRTARV